MFERLAGHTKYMYEHITGNVNNLLLLILGGKFWPIDKSIFL